MRSCSVVVGLRGDGDTVGGVKTEEQRLVQELVAYLRIAGFTVSVQHQLARRNDVRAHAGLLASGQHCVRGELDPVSTDDQAGLAMMGTSAVNPSATRRS